MKKIIDVCCGPKGMWFDKNESRTIFMDNRKEQHIVCVRKNGKSDTITITPDIIGDFTKINFPDSTFCLVVFDPPHMKRKNPGSVLSLQYGVLYDNWKEIISGGFSECFRVLKPNGILIFKWCEYSIKISDVLKLTNQKPLFGHRVGKRLNTHWVCFMKDEDARAENQGSRPNFVQQPQGEKPKYTWHESGSSPLL